MALRNIQKFDWRNLFSVIWAGQKWTCPQVCFDLLIGWKVSVSQLDSWTSELRNFANYFFILFFDKLTTLKIKSIKGPRSRMESRFDSRVRWSATWELHLQIKESCLTTLFHASLNLKISCKKTVQCTLILTFKETENFCMKKNDKWPIQILQLNFWIWQKNNKENEVINHQNFLARTNDRNFSTIIKKESNYFWWNLSLKTDLTNQNVCLASSFMSVRPLVCDLPILRQQNDWAIGVGKWPFLQMWSTA